VYTSTPNTEWTELASRQNDGLQVWLFWNRQDGRVKVAVVDARLGRRFEIGVAGADALAAFHHPFAHAPSPVCPSSHRTYNPAPSRQN
jgi:hypothetical protein